MAANFLQQRLFSTLRIGIKAGVTHNTHDGSVHCQQSDLDKACGLHCAAMALSLLGRIAYAGSLPKRRQGVAARLWKSAQDTYFEGVKSARLAELLDSLSAHLHIDQLEGSHRKTLAFTNEQLANGGLVILSWRTRNYLAHHWVLVVGVEGRQIGKTFTASALLVMDPGQAEPRLCGYNGRLQLTSRPVRGTSLYVDYVTTDGGTLPVTLTSAVSIHEAE
ncbi:MAG: hypothetical protein ABIV04_13125 [Massilia sp.]